MGGLLRQRLEEQNHTVTLARDGLEGIHAAETCDFDAIVLDVMMPGMDGVEVARRLRSTGRQTPILRAANPYSDVHRAGLCRRRSARPGWGADDYLTKTFSFRVLLARLRAMPGCAPFRAVRSVRHCPHCMWTTWHLTQPPVKCPAPVGP